MDVVCKRGEIISLDQRSLISQRYKRVTKAINTEFWNSNSDIEHSLYVGSYGRGTAINTSDIDILVELPKEDYYRYDGLKGNGQSRLLQSVKNAILSIYPRTDIHADGQVVVMNFSDGIKFEILPAFRQIDWFGNWNGKYDYPDTNMGGNWLTTDPKDEQEAMKRKNIESNGLLFDTCKHLRQIRDQHFSSYKLPGILIDSFVYFNIGGWHWLRDGEECDGNPKGTYEKRLYTSCPFWNFKLYAPGSNMEVDTIGYVEALNKVLNYMSKE